MSEATKKLLLSVSNAFSGLTDANGDLNKKGMMLCLPLLIILFLIYMYVEGTDL